MKTEFALAMNQIGSERNLPREIITQVLESALTTTYRKNANIMNSQNAAVKMDIDSGDMRVLVEKEVVEEIFDDRTEVTLEEARKENKEAQLGDLVMVDVTEKEIGRIAAQNAKQMIVQKLREAERDFQFSTFADREGEMVNGVVQSVSASSIVVNLGRVEGILPKKEQIAGERYELSGKVRAYVTEVKRNPRNMQIVLSRTHKGLLRRLLELEVPEIQKKQIEIKSIAREAGSRSKVAVLANEAGIDAVGACIGQRGARIQNIVNELHNEKIDVVEYSDDPVAYISKSLSPAKVLAVYPTAGSENKSAAVIVPDDQLSLAIGREGQNARLAAKLTGWRIDIKNSSEALTEALNQIESNAEMKEHVGDAVLRTVPQLRELLIRQRAASTALSNDEFAMIKRMLDVAHQYGKLGANAPRVAVPSRPASASVSASNVPTEMFAMPLSEMELPPRITQHLMGSGITSIGQLLELRSKGDEALLTIEGIGSKALGEIKFALEKVAGNHGQPEEEQPSKEPAAPAADVAVSTSATTEEDEFAAQIAKYGESNDDEEDESDDKKSAAGKKKDSKVKKDSKGRVLVFDEELGRTVVQRARKGGKFGDEFDDED